MKNQPSRDPLTHESTLHAELPAWSDADATNPSREDDLRMRILRVEKAIAALQEGHGILIADDGARENEVDFVFHARAASDQLVNFALMHCRGLLCVSVGAEIADRLGFLRAPQSPGLHAHTAFTLSVDAREGISSGISAQDRAQTIRLMAESESTALDFLTPGHVFPVRAEARGLLGRTGHTEAVHDICQLAGLQEAAAMCEVLGTDGRALPVGAFTSTPAHPDTKVFQDLAFVSTIDLLWYRLLIVPSGQPQGFPAHLEKVSELDISHAQEGWGEVSELACGLQGFTRPCVVHIQEAALARGSVRPEALCLQMMSGTHGVSSGCDADIPDCMVTVFSPGKEVDELPGELNAFANLSGRIGLAASGAAVRNFLSFFFALDLLSQRFAGGNMSPTEWLARTVDLFPGRSESLLMRRILELRARKG